MTRYQLHIANWENCELCQLHHGRQRVVFARGSVPAQLLFVAEAPGNSEDVIGIPLDPNAPAGGRLDKLIKIALEEFPAPPTVCFYNLVGCFPTYEGSDKQTPLAKEIKKCIPKLKEFISICRPKAIIAVGALSNKYLPGVLDDLPNELTNRILYTDIVHPAHILRQLPIDQDLLNQRCIITIRNMAKKVVAQVPIS